MAGSQELFAPELAALHVCRKSAEFLTKFSRELSQVGAAARARKTSCSRRCTRARKPLFSNWIHSSSSRDRGGSADPAKRPPLGNVCAFADRRGVVMMSLTNTGLPMADAREARLSACVQSCPTGALTYEKADDNSGRVIARDRLAASPVQTSGERIPNADRTFVPN